MVRRRTTARAIIDLEAIGLPEVIDDKAALRRAQEKNAALAEDRVKLNAQRIIESNAPRRNPNPSKRNRGVSGSMVDNYTAEVDTSAGVRGADFVLDNPTDRARLFEFGTERHEIWASGLFEAGRDVPPRTRGGRFSRGARALAFTTSGGYFFLGEMVEHPGQPETLVMEESIRELLDEMEANILDELVKGMDLRRAG